MKLLMTGGHITPAIAVIDECIKQNIAVILVGRTYAYKREIETMEAKLVKARNINHIHLDAGRFSRTFSYTSLLHFIKIPQGFIRSLFIVAKIKPDIILTFGGYIALPIAIAGWILRIPVYLHEQVIVPGLTNRIIARICKKIFISFPESAQYFPTKKTVISGNPIRQSMFSHSTVKEFEHIKKPILYITGGSLGSHAINMHIEKIVPKLLQQFVVIHQTGNIPPYNDYERLLKLQLPDYYIYEHILEEQISYIFGKADVIVSRSGANTIFELIVTKTPAVLIPLPNSGYGEQFYQAKLLEKAGCAEIFMQHEQSEQLYHRILQVYKEKEKYQNNFMQLQKYYKKDSTQIILSEMGLLNVSAFHI